MIYQKAISRLGEERSNEIAAVFRFLACVQTIELTFVIDYLHEHSRASEEELTRASATRSWRHGILHHHFPRKYFEPGLPAFTAEILLDGLLKLLDRQ